MIRNVTMSVLLKMGMPARIKGTTYICDAVELFDTDPYYPEGKICSLYSEIASIHGTTATSVERAIRHAFETTLEKGDTEILNQYLDTTNTQNSNLLRTLYFRVKQKCKRTQPPYTCNAANCILKDKFSQEAISLFCKELAIAVASQLKSL